MKKNEFCKSLVVAVSLFAVLVTAVPVVAATYYSETFNSYATNKDLHAVWSKKNLDELYTDEGDVGGGIPGVYTTAENADWRLNSLTGARPNPPSRDGSPTSGQSISCDSDWSGGDDGGNGDIGYSLTSPGFNTTGASNVFLHFSCDAIMNDNGGTVFEVYLYNGSTWNMILQRVGAGRLMSVGGFPDPTPTNADGVYGVVDVDISSLAANKTGVKVRFISRGNSDDWWISVDDVTVDNINLGVTGTTTLLPTETFSSVADGAIPANWTRLSGCNENPWQVGNLIRYWDTEENGHLIQGRTINRLDAKYATFDSDQDPDTCPDAEYLITPAVSTVGYTVLYLIFDSELVNTAASEKVQISIDDGATWNAASVWTYDARGEEGEDVSFTHHVVPVYGVGGNAKVRFRFCYVGNGDNWYWAIDNVTITAGQGDLPPAAPSVSNPTTSFSLDTAKSEAGCTGFVTSAFVPTAAETHGRTDYQVIKVGGNFDAPILSGSVSTGDLTKFSVTGLTSPGSYQVRARHVTANLVPGSYGAAFSFVVGGPEGTGLLASEDFDGLAGILQPAADEATCTGSIAEGVLGWTHQPPAGWSINNDNMSPTVGVTEWQGWSFSTMSFWTDADQQARENFTLSSGVLAIADPDEWDDCNGPAGSGNFDSVLISPSYQVPKNADAFVMFDSHYRQEDPMEGAVRVSINGGADQTLLHYCCAGIPSGEGGGDNNGADVQNSNVMLHIPPNASAAYNLVVKWNLYNAGNNWFWAIDNFKLFVEGITPVENWEQY